MKKYLIIGSLALAGFLVYKHFTKKEDDTGLPNPEDALEYASQPSQVNPIVTEFDERVDGDVSEPFYVGDDDIITDLQAIGDGDITDLVEGLTDINLVSDGSEINFV